MKKKTLTQVPLEVLVHLRYLYQDKGIRGKEILKMYPKLSKVTIYWHPKKLLADKTVDKRKHNHGKPRRISPWDKHLILHQTHILREQYGSFMIKRLRVTTEVKKDVSDKTVRHVLHGAGYRFLHSKKKGLLKKHDLKKRHKFAQKVAKMLTNKFWEEGISFYIDAAGFQDKHNPHVQARPIQTMTWWLKNEGWHPDCSAKGSYMGSGGRAAIFIVAIAHQKVLFYVKSMKAKLMETCSQISSKHTFKKLSVDAGFQKAKGFFKMNVLYKTVKRQDKLWIQLEQSNLEYLVVQKILIL